MFFKNKKKSTQSLTSVDEQLIQSLQVHVMPEVHPSREEGKKAQERSHGAKKWIVVFGGGSAVVIVALAAFFFLFQGDKKMPSVDRISTEKPALVAPKSPSGGKGGETTKPSQATEDDESAPSPDEEAETTEEEGSKEPQVGTSEQTQQPIESETAQDADSDGLSDREEDLYRTHIRRADSDGDGYKDGEEVLHLYAPNAALQRLSESSAIAQYVHPERRYRVLYPSKLENQTLREEKTFFYDTTTGDAISLDWKTLAPDESFESWLAKESQVEGKDVIVQPLSGGNEAYTVFETSDQSIRYVVLPTAVLVFSYIPGNVDAKHLKTTFDMMLRSFHQG